MHRLRTDDRGSGLIMVVGSMMVLMTLSLTVLAFTMESQRFARYDQDYSSAMTAAQSGVEDFISRLNREDGYAVTPDCANAAWKGPDVIGNTCGWTSSTAVGWAAVNPADTSNHASYFHYSVDSKDLLTQGLVQLTVTGRANGVYRTIETSVGKGGSTDYVYYTDYESADPANVQAYDPATTQYWSTADRNACGLNLASGVKPLYWWQGRGSAPCVEITFIGGDELDGEVFTNDTIFATARTYNGVWTEPSFLKQVYTADAECKNAGTTDASWEDHCLRANGVANFNGTKPLYADPLYLDDTSASFASFPGCHYYGATRVEFHSNGTMTVWNRKSVNNNTPPVSIAGPTGSSPTCGTLDQLDSTAGATVNVPDEMVLYVDTSTANARQCSANEIGGTSGRTLPLGTYTSSLPATPSGTTPSYTVDTNMTEATKTCNRGNLYVEGTVKGRVTLATSESIVVTGDLVLAGGMNGPDMLGLVAQNSVEVFHPRLATVSPEKVNPYCNHNCTYRWGSPYNESEVATWPTRYSDPTVGAVSPAYGIQIAGSIQTLQHSFLVQKYNTGPSTGLGLLVVNGSIAQRFRGIVGQGSYGYTKDYNYDTRLQYSAPPYFPRWAKSQWSLRYSGEINTPTVIKTS